MNIGRQSWVAGFLILLAAVLQGRLAHALTLHGAQPEFILIFLTCCSILIGNTSGIFLGLWAGLLTAILVPGDFGSYLASRTLAGAFAGELQRFMIRDSLLVPSLAVVATTLIAETVFLLMVPHHPRLQLRAGMGEILYNAVLAFPIYFALRFVHLGRR